MILLAKVRLMVRVRVQGARIESVPLKHLVDLSSYPKCRWSLEVATNGVWLILEAF